MGWHIVDTVILVCVTVPGVWVGVEGSHFLQNTGYLVWCGGLFVCVQEEGPSS